MSLTPEQLRRIVDLAADLARAGDTDELAQFLANGLPVDTVTESGDSLLMLAAYHSHAEAVAMLLGNGADPDLLNLRGQSPLAGAIFKGADDVVRVLIDAGADPDAGTPTAHQVAAMFGLEPFE